MQSDWRIAFDRLGEIQDIAVAALPNLLVAAMVIALFWLVARAVSAGLRRALSRYGYADLAPVLGRVSRWAINFLGVLVALVVIFPTFRAGDLIQVLGIGSVAVGFAFRDILQNFLAGILILLTRPFRIGDQIVFKDYEGTVQDIQTRATFITTYDGRRVVIPNAELFTNSVLVNTAFDKRRSEHDVGIGYGDAIGRASDVILRAMRAVDGVLPEPAPDVLTFRLANSSVVLRARWWTHSRRADVLEVQCAVLREIREALGRAGIDLPFPTRTVLLHDQTEETDGDRVRQREGWPPPQDGESPRPVREAMATRESRAPAPARVD